jgi:hypothetical protein
MTKVPTPATALLTVMAAATPATLTLSGLTHTYSGNPQGAVVTTAPAGLSHSITYSGSKDSEVAGSANATPVFPCIWGFSTELAPDFSVIPSREYCRSRYVNRKRSKFFEVPRLMRSESVQHASAYFLDGHLLSGAKRLGKSRPGVRRRLFRGRSFLDSINGVLGDRC